MKCRCKLNNSIPYKDSNGNFLEFIKGEYYDYNVDTHKETGMLLYLISIESYVRIPMIQGKFDIIFDDIEKLREDKLNTILN
jgi:hypothetical protein